MTITYIYVLLLMLVETIIPPIPSEMVLLVSAVSIVEQRKSILLLIAFATLGSYLGACFFYFIARKFSVETIYRLNSKLKVLGYKKQDIDKCINIFNKYKYISVLMGRTIPVIRSLISLPAGLCKMNFFRFSILTLIGSLIFNSGLIFVGVFFKSKIDFVVKIINNYSYIIIGFIILILIIKSLKNKILKSNS